MFVGIAPPAELAVVTALAELVAAAVADVEAVAEAVAEADVVVPLLRSAVLESRVPQ